jgi:translation elongation factor EF-1beta
MITFKEKQTKIYVGKHKLTPSSFGIDFIDLHLVTPEEPGSGYEIVTRNPKTKEINVEQIKSVRVISFENLYPIDEVKQEINNGFLNIKYFENGGYAYLKKEF